MTGLTSPIEFGWHLPTSGDGRYIGVPSERSASLDYLVEVSREAEAAGFEFILIPTGGACIDAWIVGSMIASQTTSLKPLVAARPGLIAPVLAARMGASLDTLSGGRALINIVTGGNPADLKATGDPLYDDHDGRYERTREFVRIMKQVWDSDSSTLSSARDNSEPGVHYKGRYYEINGGICQPLPVQRPHPPIYFGGSSPAGKQAAAEIADVYLMWAEPIDMIREQIAEMESYLRQYQEMSGTRRTLRYGLRAQLVVRQASEEAWQAAWDILRYVDDSTLRTSERQQSRIVASNQERQTRLWKSSVDNDFVIGPNLWAGLASVRTGGSIAIVGNPEEVSDRILEYMDTGITSFILSGYPHLEEARIAGQLLLPLLKRKIAERAKAGHTTQIIR